MRDISVFDLYYKVEDKWFDLLDWLSDHGIPVYKIVDPLEQNGIPSLPVFIAALVIIILLLWVFFLGGALGGLFGGAPTYSVLIQVANQDAGAVADASITILQNGEVIGDDTTDEAGIFEVELEEGTYDFEVSATDCTSLTKTFSVSELSKRLSIIMSCAGEVEFQELEFCVSPDSLGEIRISSYDEYSRDSPGVTCGIDECKADISEDKSYVFTAHSYSSNIYSSDTLVALGDECIEFEVEELNLADRERGLVSVVVEQEDGSLASYITVKLVDPSNSDTVVAVSTTNVDGVADFSEPIGTKFKIYIPSLDDGTLAAYFGNETHEFEEDPQTITVRLELSTPTTVITKEGAANLAGVLVSIFDENDRTVDAKTTGSAGTAVFGLTAGKSYRVGLFKQGYEYAEDTVIGGEQKIVNMERIEVVETGTIHAKTVFQQNQRVVQGAHLTLYIYANGTIKKTGYGVKVTDQYGKAIFDWVLPGEYCLIASRQGGTPTICDDVVVTVEAGRKYYPVIEMDANTYNLLVKVVDEGRNALSAKSVKIYDDFDIEVASGTTDAVGEVVFDILEGTNIYAQVDHVRSEKITMKEDRELTVVLSSLESDSPQVRFVGVYDYYGEAIELGKTKLEAGKTYFFKFNLDMPDYAGNRWDEIKFSIDAANIRIRTEDLELVDFKDVDVPVTGAVVTGALSPHMEIRISGFYDPHDRTVALSIPVRVKPVFSGEHLYNIDYSAIWTYGEISPPASGIVRTVRFNVTAGEHFYSPDKDLTVRLFLIEDGVEVPSPNSAVIDFNKVVTLGVEITNENAEQSYSEKITIETERRNVRFGDVSVTGNGVFTIHPKTDTSNEKITVEDYNFHTGGIGYGEKLGINITTRTVSSGYTLIRVYAGTARVGMFIFLISGDVGVKVRIQEEYITEFTPQFKLEVVEELNNEPVEQLSKVVLSGDAVENGPSCEYGPFDESTDGIYTINIKDECDLRSGDLEITVSGSRGGRGIETTTLEEKVYGCIHGVPPTTENIPARREVTLSNEVEVSLQCETQGIAIVGIYDDALSVSDCTACELKAETVVKSSDFLWNVPFTFEYDADVAFGSTVEKTVSTRYTARSSKNIKKEYATDTPLTIVPEEKIEVDFELVGSDGFSINPKGGTVKEEPYREINLIIKIKNMRNEPIEGRKAPINITDNYLNIYFSSVKEVKIGDTPTGYVEFSENAEKQSIQIIDYGTPQTQGTEEYRGLGVGDTLEIKVGIIIVTKGYVIVPVEMTEEVNGEMQTKRLKEAYFSIDTKPVTPEIRTTPENIYEFTPQMQIAVTEPIKGNAMTNLQIVELSGSAVDVESGVCSLSNARIKPPARSGGDYYLADFSDRTYGCPIKAGELTIRVKSSDVPETTITKTVGSCIKLYHGTTRFLFVNEDYRDEEGLIAYIDIAGECQGLGLSVDLPPRDSDVSAEPDCREDGYCTPPYGDLSVNEEYTGCRTNTDTGGTICDVALDFKYGEAVRESDLSWKKEFTVTVKARVKKDAVLIQTHDLEIPVMLTNNPEGVGLASKIFTPLVIQKYNINKDYDCVRKWCSLEQALEKWGTQTTNLVDFQGEIVQTENIVERLREGKTDPATSVTYTDVDVYTYPDQMEGTESYFENACNTLGTNCLAILDSVDPEITEITTPLPRAGQTVIGQTNAQFDTGKQRKHAYLSFSNLDPLTPSTGNIQLFMPASLIENRGSTNEGAYNTLLTVDGNDFDDSAATSIHGLLKNLMREQWGTLLTDSYLPTSKTTDSDYSTKHVKYDHEIIVEKCADVTSQNCQDLKTVIVEGDVTKIPAIYLDSEGRIHIVGKNEATVKDLINQLTYAVDPSDGSTGNLGLAYNNKILTKALTEFGIHTTIGLSPENKNLIRAVIAKAKNLNEVDVTIPPEYSTVGEAYLSINDCFYRDGACTSDEENYLTTKFQKVWEEYFRPPDTGIYWSNPNEYHAYGEESYIFANVEDADSLQNAIDLLNAKLATTPDVGFAKTFLPRERIDVTYGYQEMTMNELNKLVITNGLSLTKTNTYSTIVKIRKTTDDCHINPYELGGYVEKIEKTAIGTTYRSTEGLYPGTTYFITIHNITNVAHVGGVNHGFMVYAKALTDETGTLPTEKCYSTEQLNRGVNPVSKVEDTGLRSAGYGGLRCGYIMTECGARDYLHWCEYKDSEVAYCPSGHFCVKPAQCDCRCPAWDDGGCFNCNKDNDPGTCVKCPAYLDTPVYYKGKCYEDCPSGTKTWSGSGGSAGSWNTPQRCHKAQ